LGVGRGKYRCKIAYNKYEPNRTTRRFHIDALREVSMVMRFQQQLEEEFGKLGTEQVTEGESHIEEDWKVERGHKSSSRTNK
jgi:hypothetical protein